MVGIMIINFVTPLIVVLVVYLIFSFVDHYIFFEFDCTKYFMKGGCIWCWLEKKQIIKR